MEKIAFIVEKKNGKFKAQIATAVLDDTDSSLFIVASSDPFDSEDEAVTFLDENLPSDIDKVFKKSIKSNEGGELFWLSQLEKANA